MADRDGSFTYSKTISLYNKATGFAAIAYPNPVYDVLTLQIHIVASLKVAIEVYDMSGKVLMRRQQLAGAGSSTVTVNVKSLSAGAYMVRVTGGAASNNTV
ncbi:MAG TPA: T9SS type A sorting domain-containing protein [Chitinophagaceae bacterium]|nr:T9SS type A sorting domain-containing protein [Chitinophagaceae bacterium]